MEEVHWDPTTIETLVQGLDPVDWTQLELLARQTRSRYLDFVVFIAATGADGRGP